MIDALLAALGVALLVLGVTVIGVTVYGMMRLRGLFPRLQAASKGAMLGTVAILAASIGTGDGTTIGRCLVVALFLLLTTPVAAHAIGQAAYRRELEGDSDSTVDGV